MNRRRAAAVAGAVTATAVAAALAIGVNFGLFGLTSNTDRVGTLRPVDMPGATLVTGSIAATGATAAPDPEADATTDPDAAGGTATVPAGVVAPGSGHPDGTAGTNARTNGHESPEHADADD